MAFYDEKDEDKEQSLNGPVSLSAESGVVGSGQNAVEPEAQGSTATVPKQNFVGITDYINANKPQSEKLAGQVTGAIDQKAQAVDTELGNTQSSFNQLADSQTVQGNDDLLNQVKTDATGVAGDAAKKSSFEKLRDASYSGPQKLEDIDSGQAWANLQSKLQTARAAKDSVNSEEGRMGLIKEISNNPRQSQGALTFDNLLLQSNPDSAAKLQAAGSNLNDIDARLNQASTGAAAKAKSIADANAATSSAAKGAVGQGLSNLFGAEAGADQKYGTEDDVNLNLDTSLLGRSTAAQQKQQNEFNQLQSRVQSGQLSPEDYAAFGVDQGSKTFGNRISDYLNFTPDANTKNVANENDYSQLAALQALAGEGGQSADFLNPTTDKNLIGTVGKGYNFNKGGFDTAVSGRKADYESKKQALINDFNKTAPIPSSTQKWADWLLDGKAIPDFGPKALEDFAKTSLGQNLLKLSRDYDYSATPENRG